MSCTGCSARCAATPGRSTSPPRASAEPAVTSTSTRGIDRIDELVAESVAAGLPTELAIIGDAHAVSPVIDLSAYRIAQEALTNVRKHAGAAATAEVRIRSSDAAVEVEVTNTGAVRGAVGASGAPAARHTVGGSDADWSDAGGLGQLGMRERVTAAPGARSSSGRAPAAATSCGRGSPCVAARRPARDPGARRR